MAIIFVLSSQSGLRISEDVAVERPFRVVAHLGIYALLAGLVLFGLGGVQRPSLRNTTIAFVVAVIYGATDELHQSFVPDRTGRLDDLLTDTVGAVIGLVIAYAVLTWLARQRTQVFES